MDEMATVSTGRGRRPGRRLSPFMLIRLLGIGLFIFILTTVDLGELWKNIRQVKVDYFLYAMAFQLLLLLAKALLQQHHHLLGNGAILALGNHRNLPVYIFRTSANLQ